MSKRPLSLCVLPLMLWAGLAPAASLDSSERHYDARAGLRSSLTLDQLRSQAQVPQGLAADVQELSALEVDEITGAVRSLSSERGFLSAAAPGKPMTVAMDFVRKNVAALGLEASDLDGYTISDVVYSKITGATHIYLQQRYQGIPVYNAQLQINVNREGRIISVNNSFMAGAAARGTCAEAGQAIAGGGERSPEVLRHESDRSRHCRYQPGRECRHLARAHRRLADAVAGPAWRGAAGVEFPDPHARQAAHVGSDGGRQHRAGVDTLRLGLR